MSIHSPKGVTGMGSKTKILIGKCEPKLKFPVFGVVCFLVGVGEGGVSSNQTISMGGVLLE